MAKQTDDVTDQTTFAPPAATTTDGKTPPKPIQLSSAHDVALTRHALATHADDLDGVSKKVKEAGYDREARTISADAGAIRQGILPRFGGQTEIALVSPAALEEQIANAIKVEIYRMFDGLDDPQARISAAGMRGRRDRLVTILGSRLTAHAQELATAAWNAGYQARTLTSEVLAAGCVGTLGGGRAD